MFVAPGHGGTATSPPSQDAASPTQLLPLQGRRFRLSAWDFAGMFLGFLLTIAITLVNARGRIFWEDEMLGWLLLRDPSWHHMIQAWNLGADGGGFSFYLLGRTWFRFFGDSVLTFRLFSSTCFGVAFVALWAALRRFYPVAIVAFAAFNSVFFSPPLTTHFLEGRFYGLLVMSTALALWLALVLDEAPDPVPKRFYPAIFLVHGLLTTSHVLGVVYSFFLLTATVLLDRRRDRKRVALYLTAAASWLLLVPERSSILAAGRVGKPHFWTKAPGPAEILGAWTGFSREIQLVLALLLCAAALSLWLSPGGVRAALHARYRERRAIYIVAGCLLLVPVWFLAEGVVGTWLFTDRYLQPVTLGIAPLTAELLLIALALPSLVRLHTRWRGLSLAAVGGMAIVYAAALVIWDFHHVAQMTPEPTDFTRELAQHLPGNLPVVVEDAFTFTSLLGRQAEAPMPYTFLLDWPWALNPEAPRLEVTQYHLMQNWKQAGYFADHIQNAADFLRENPRFLVLHNGPITIDPLHPKPEIGNPLAERLSRSPDYEVRKVFTLDRLNRDGARDTVWLVCRGGCGAASAIREPAYCRIADHRTDCCTGAACTLPALPPPPRFWHVEAW